MPSKEIDLMQRRPALQARIDVVAKELMNGMGRAALLRKYAKKWGIAETTIDRYITNARKQAQEAQELKRKAEADALYQNSFEAEKRRLLSRDEKREILAKIARGEMLVPKLFATGNGFRTVEANPEYLDIMKAIDMDSKMEGDYAASKFDHTSGGKPLEAPAAPQIIIGIVPQPFPTNEDDVDAGQ